MTNCPNCGAPIEHDYSYSCSYCKTLIKGEKAKPKVEEKEKESIAPLFFSIEEVNIHKDPLMNTIIVEIIGTTQPLLRAEFSDKNGNISLQQYVSDAKKRSQCFAIEGNNPSRNNIIRAVLGLMPHYLIIDNENFREKLDDAIRKEKNKCFGLDILLE